MIDARGKYIIPGLVDAHVHYDQSGWVDARPGVLDVTDRFPYAEVIADLREHPERFHRSYLCSGVTAVFDVGGYPWDWDRREAAERSTAAPHYAAAGPLFSTIPRLMEPHPGEHLNIFMADEEAVRSGVRMLAENETDAAKVYVLPVPEDREAVRAHLRVLAEEAERAGIPVIAHATTLQTAKEALRDGRASMLVHSVEDTLVDAEFLELARQNEVVYVPTMLVGRGYDELAARHFQPGDLPLECVDAETRRKVFLTGSLPPQEDFDLEAYQAGAEAHYERLWENLRRVHEAGITVAMGTDAGNPLTLHGPAVYPEMEAMAGAGLTPMQVLVASTRNGARAMGRTDFGTVERNMIADLVVLDRDPLADISNVRSVRMVVRGGKTWTREELEYQ